MKLKKETAADNRTYFPLRTEAYKKLGPSSKLARYVETFDRLFNIREREGEAMKMIISDPAFQTTFQGQIGTRQEKREHLIFLLCSVSAQVKELKIS